MAKYPCPCVRHTPPHQPCYQQQKVKKDDCARAASRVVRCTTRPLAATLLYFTAATATTIQPSHWYQS